MSRAPSRRELYSEATRAALLDTATGMFAEHGYAATALDDIASATQVTRGAVYHHFANKQALFEAVLDVQEQAMVEHVLAEAARHQDPWDAALAALDVFLDRCCDPVYARLCWLEAPLALGWARWNELEIHHAYGMIENFVTVLVAAGLAAPAPTQVMAQLVFHLIGGAGRTIAAAPEESRAATRDACGTVMKLMMAGLRAA